jgi:hypothetical protein
MSRSNSVPPLEIISIGGIALPALADRRIMNSAEGVFHLRARVSTIPIKSILPENDHLPRYFDGLRMRSSRSVSNWRRVSSCRRC